jgi:hypothetical protein
VDFVELKPRIALMIKRKFAETVPLEMTIRAMNFGRGTKLSGMGVAMTILTVSTRGHTKRSAVFIGLSRRLVAGRALGRGVSTAQWKFCPARMIEDPFVDLIESIGCVTGRATAGKAILVGRVEVGKRVAMDIGMAILATRTRSMELPHQLLGINDFVAAGVGFRRRMADVASHRAVCSREWKTRCVVLRQRK